MTFIMFCKENEGFCGQVYNATSAVFDFISTQLDLLYLRWLLSLIYPTILAVILLPLFIVVLLYISSLLLYLYYHRHNVFTVLQETIESRDPWIGGRYLVCLLWDAHGYIWHGYEIKGLENLPEEGGGVIVYYHGALPVDAYYFTARILLKKGKLLRCIGDKFLFKIPGWRALLEAFQIKAGTVDSCVEEVKEGHLITISPGGVREAQFSDHMYQLIWGFRTGFAKVAIRTNCPLIPMFTENIRESFRTFCWPLRFWVSLHEFLKLPVAPVYGGFPVKLRTHVGRPIYPLPDETPEEFAIRGQDAVRALIERHQKLPGNIFRALFARIFDRPKSD